MRNRKAIIIVGVIIGLFLLILLCCCVTVLYLGKEADKHSDELDNEVQDMIEEFEDENDSNSSENLEENHNESNTSKDEIITLRPQNTDLYQKFESDPSEICDSIQGGIVRYGNPDDWNKSMVVNNSELQMTEKQEEEFETARAFITGAKNLTDESFAQGLLPTFVYYCSGAAHQYLGELDVIHPDAEDSRVVLTLGGSQASTDSLESQNMTIFVYGKKGNNIFAIYEMITADKLFTDVEAESCMAVSESNFEYLDWSCLADLYSKVPSKKFVAEKTAEALIKEFRLVE